MRNKKSSLLIAVLAGLISLPALAADTAPAVSGTSSAPAAVLPKPAPRVEVFAFTPVSDGNQNDWTGRGIQENLQSDVSRTGATLVLAQRPTAANDDLTVLAKQNHADLVVSGSYQVAGNQIRVNGHVTDVATNATVGGFSATGNQQDLFKVEDALGEQLRALLPRPATAQQVSDAYQAPPAPPVVYPAETASTYTAAQPVYSAAQPAATYYYSEPAPSGYYSPDYYYSDYGAGYYPGYFGFYGGVGYVYGGYGRGYRGDYRGYGYGYGGRGYYHGGGFGHASVGVGGGFHGGAVGGARGGFGGGGHGGGGGGHR